MAPGGSSSVPAADPIEHLAQRIIPHPRQKGDIKLGKDLTSAVKERLKAVRAGQGQIVDNHVVQIVSALEDCYETCSRIDPAAFAVILQTLLLAQYSRHKERGIVLLTASLHRNAHKIPPLKSINERKAIIGGECLHRLLSCFTDSDENSRIRRWVGVLMVQLLEDSDNNSQKFEACPEDSKRELGRIVIEEKNEIVRSTCGQLLKILIAWEIPKENLWPVESDPTLYDDFPLPSQKETTWNKAFQAYVDKQVSQLPSSDHGNLYFAQALVIQPMGVKLLTAGGNINIWVDDNVSICTPSSKDIFTESVEIPFQLIKDYEVRKSQIEGLEDSRVVDLILRLEKGGAVSCYRNAVHVDISEIRLTIDNADLVADVVNDIMQPRTVLKASQSQEIIAIMSGRHDPASLEENDVDDGSNRDRTELYLDPAVLSSREQIQDDGQDVKFGEFIEDDMQETHIQVNATQPESQSGEDIRSDIGLAEEAIYEDKQNETGNPEQFRSPLPAGASHQIGSDGGNSAEREDIRDHEAESNESPSRRTLHSKGPLPKSTPEPAIEEEISNDGSGEIIRQAMCIVTSSGLSSQSKSKPNRSKIEPKTRVKHKASGTSAPDGGIKKLKKYSLKTRTEASPLKIAASKRPTASKTSALTVSNPKASVSRPASRYAAPKPKPASKTPSDFAVKALPKRAPEALVPKKKAADGNPNPHPRQSRKELPKLVVEPQEETHPGASPAKHAPLHSETVADEILNKEVRPRKSRIDRLSQALADVVDIEHGDASITEPEQKNPAYQPPQVTTPMESSPSPVVQRTPALPQEEMFYDKSSSPEVMDLLPENDTDNSPHVENQSESSPSSLDRVSPIPLPAQRASPAEQSVQENTDVRPKNLTVTSEPRRSPRLASRYGAAEASLALGTVLSKALRQRNKPVPTGLTGNKKPEYTDRGCGNDSPFRASEAPLLDDHLARKTPLISFGVKGPRNQGKSSSKKSPLQRVGKNARIEEIENPPPVNQTYTRIFSNKRKHEEEDAPMVENSKRQQSSRLKKKTADHNPNGRRESPIIARKAEIATVSRNLPIAQNTTQKTSRFGSQGSRVNENGSPRGRSQSQEDNYKAIVRKALRDQPPTHKYYNVYGDNFLDFGNDNEGPDVMESEQEFILDRPVTPSVSFRVQPLSPRQNEEVLGRHHRPLKSRTVDYRPTGMRLTDPQPQSIEDPFLKEDPEKNMSSFARRLQYRRQTPIRRAKENPRVAVPLRTRYDVIEDQEATLVNIENEHPMQEYSPSSVTASESSDEDQDHAVHKATTEVQQDQRDEWRMALKPHQRGILDVLNQVSADLVRYLISHEQATEDVLAEYEEGCALLMKNLEKQRQDDRRQVQRDLDNVKMTMALSYKEARLEISRLTKGVLASPVLDFEREWMQEQDRMQRLVEEGIQISR